MAQLQSWDNVPGQAFGKRISRKKSSGSELPTPNSQELFFIFVFIRFGGYEKKEDIIKARERALWDKNGRVHRLEHSQT